MSTVFLIFFQVFLILLLNILKISKTYYILFFLCIHCFFIFYRMFSRLFSIHSSRFLRPDGNCFYKKIYIFLQKRKPRPKSRGYSSRVYSKRCQVFQQLYYHFSMIIANKKVPRQNVSVHKRMWGVCHLIL